LVDEQWPHDIELIDQELLIVKFKYINTSSELEDALSRAERLVTYLTPQLSRARFSPIGDHAHTL
jgi:hypothetical protein